MQDLTKIFAIAGACLFLACILLALVVSRCTKDLGEAYTKHIHFNEHQSRLRADCPYCQAILQNKLDTKTNAEL